MMHTTIIVSINSNSIEAKTMTRVVCHSYKIQFKTSTGDTTRTGVDPFAFALKLLHECSQFGSIYLLVYYAFFSFLKI